LTGFLGQLGRLSRLVKNWHRSGIGGPFGAQDKPGKLIILPVIPAFSHPAKAHYLGLLSVPRASISLLPHETPVGGHDF